MNTAHTTTNGRTHREVARDIYSQVLSNSDKAADTQAIHYMDAQTAINKALEAWNSETNSAAEAPVMVINNTGPEPEVIPEVESAATVSKSDIMKAAWVIVKENGGKRMTKEAMAQAKARLLAAAQVKAVEIIEESAIVVPCVVEASITVVDSTPVVNVDSAQPALVCEADPATEFDVPKLDGGNATGLLSFEEIEAKFFPENPPKPVLIPVATEVIVEAVPIPEVTSKAAPASEASVESAPVIVDARVIEAITIVAAGMPVMDVTNINYAQRERDMARRLALDAGSDVPMYQEARRAIALEDRRELETWQAAVAAYTKARAYLIEQGEEVNDAVITIAVTEITSEVREPELVNIGEVYKPTEKPVVTVAETCIPTEVPVAIIADVCVPTKEPIVEPVVVSEKPKAKRRPRKINADRVYEDKQLTFAGIPPAPRKRRIVRPDIQAIVKRAWVIAKVRAVYLKVPVKSCFSQSMKQAYREAREDGWTGSTP